MTRGERLTPDVTLYEGDCREVLAELPGMMSVITDPPYGISLASHGNWFRGMRAVAGDTSQEVGQSVIDGCVHRGWPVCAFASPGKRWAGRWRQDLVWDKGGAVGIGGDRNTCWKFTWELIQVGQFAAVYGGRDEAVLAYHINPANYADHPCAKPLPLMRYLVRKLTRPGDVVFDPFAGSGSLAVAAMATGRRCVLVESDPAYCEVIRRRVREAADDGLFAAAGTTVNGSAESADLFAGVPCADPS